MKLEWKLGMKASLQKSTKKKGIERNCKIFENLKNGEKKFNGKDEIIEKDNNGKCFVYLITGFERFDEK